MPESELWNNLLCRSNRQAIVIAVCDSTGIAISVVASSSSSLPNMQHGILFKLQENGKFYCFKPIEQLIWDNHLTVASYNDVWGELTKIRWITWFNAAFWQRPDKMLSNVRRSHWKRRRLCTNDVQKVQTCILLVLFAKPRRKLPFMSSFLICLTHFWPFL